MSNVTEERKEEAKVEEDPEEAPRQPTPEQ